MSPCLSHLGTPHTTKILKFKWVTCITQFLDQPLMNYSEPGSLKPFCQINRKSLCGAINLVHKKTMTNICLQISYPLYSSPRFVHNFSRLKGPSESIPPAWLCPTHLVNPMPWVPAWTLRLPDNPRIYKLM